MSSARATPSPAAPSITQSFSRHLFDFEGFSELFGQWGGQFHQMSRGPFRGAAHVASGRVLRIFHAETNQEVLTRGMDSASFATFIPITPRNVANSWQGRRLAVGELIAKSPEVEYCNQTRRDTVIRALLVPLKTLREAARHLSGGEPAKKPVSWAALKPSPEKMARLQNGLDELLARSLRDPQFLESPEGFTLENEILRGLINCLEGRPVSRPLPSRHGGRSQIVKDAVVFMHDRLDQPLTVFDLCAGLGVSDRSLRRAFQESFGMGPLAYFRVIRVHRARADLHEGRGGDATVVEIARRWGFTRLGPFAAEYRRQFGELPSETLGVRGWPGVQRMVRAVD